MISKTLIIAEAGVNHNGDINIARKLIDAAAWAGADLVKFQTFNAECQVTRTAGKARYQKLVTNSAETQYEMLRALELTHEMHLELMSHCSMRNIGFLSTAFDIQSVNFLESLGQTRYKIPSGELTNLPYLRHIGKLEKTVLLSTGMATLAEVKAAISALEQAGTTRANITVLHCTTEYPAPMGEVNLSAMQTMSNCLGLAVGYSDHTQGIEAAIAAVAMGAKVIEKHFTLDRNLPGPDHQASVEPIELKAMVLAIRNIELAIGDGIKRPTASELINIPIVRKSLVAKKSIKMGEVLTPNNITTKRPGGGLSPMLWDEVIGRVAWRDYSADDLIEL